MINSGSIIQRMLFNNSEQAIARQRFSPYVFDPQFHPMRNLKSALLKAKRASDGFATVIDIGCGIMPYKKYFKDSKYIGIDEYASLPDVKKINIETSFFEKEADFVICSEVLEHSFNFTQVVDNIFNNLKPGGTAFVSVPFAYEIHGWDYHDYFRYTHEALTRIFSRFSHTEVTSTNTYVATLIQKWNNVIFYIPIPYILKIPFFLVNNTLFYIAEYLVRAFLKIFRVPKDNLAAKLIFSYPINFVCTIKK